MSKKIKESKSEAFASASGRPANRLALRAFFINEKTSKPIANLPVVAAMKRKLPSGEMMFVVGKLATSQNGYVSFKVEFEKFNQAEEIFIYPVGKEELAQAVGQNALATNGEHLHYIKLNEAILNDVPREALYPVQYADLMDYEYLPLFNSSMPKSCTTTKDNTKTEEDDEDCGCHPDEDCCAIIPQFPIEECNKIFQFDRPKETDNKPIQYTHNENGETSTLIVEKGIIRQYESCYTPLGYSLGDLLHTLPLAPCESVNIGIKNWFREDYSSRSDVIDRSETLENQVIRSKNAHEFIKSKMSQHSFNVGISAAFKIKAAPIGVNLGYAFGSKKASAEMVQEINETQKQLSNAYSSYKSLVVTETTQKETLEMRTRNVTNHNHCHSLTMMYYEVIQNLKVATSFLRSKEAVFVQYPTPCFTKNDVICNRHILREVLLDMKLLECLDNVCLDPFICEDGDAGGNGNTGDDDCIMTNKLRFSVRIADKALAGSEGNLYIILTDVDGNTYKHYIPHTGDNRYEKNKTYTTEVSIAPICVDKLDTISLELVGNNKIILSSLAVDYYAMSPHHSWNTLWSGGLSNMELKDQTKLVTNVLNPILPTIPDPTGDDPAEPGSEVSLDCCLNNLLQHLNCNKHFYYKILWMLEDQNKRAVRFENHVSGNVPLLDIIINQPIGVIGDWVVFEMANSPWVLAPSPQTEEMIINAPTGNLFTEALLGHCNSCEVIDEKRFWDWTGKTCPNSAPELDLDTLSKYQAIASALGNPFQNPLLQLQGITGLGNPSSALGSILQEFAKTNIVSNPTFAKEVMQDLIKLLNESPAASSNDPDTKSAFDSVLEKAKKLKELFESLEGLFGQ